MVSGSKTRRWTSSTWPGADHYDEETERLTRLGARPLSENKLPAVRWTTFADPEGNEFDLVTWQPE